MEVRERIMQAAIERLSAVGYDALTITAVAALAGVSRPTVYTAFGSRENLASEAVWHASAEALVRITGKAAGATTAADYLVEVMVAATQEFRRAPALIQVALARAGGLEAAGEPFGPAAIQLATSFLVRMVELEPSLADDLDEIAELASRLLLSMVMFESDRVRSDDSLRAFLRRRLVPALGLAPHT